MVVGRNKRVSLNYIKDRVWNKLQEWKEKLLSQARKEVLLKAIVQAILAFAMICIKLPISLCHDIEMMIYLVRAKRRSSKNPLEEVGDFVQNKSSGLIGI